jgi:transcriptional regulator with XRE-family HTH domain
MSLFPSSGLVASLLRQPLPPGQVVRIARTTLKLNQAHLAKRCHTSASQISRWETGATPLRDVTTLRTLAAALGLPPEVFGLTSDTAAAPAGPGHREPPRVLRVTASMREDDPVRRRMFFLVAGLTGASLTSVGPAFAVAAEVDPADLLANQLGDVLLGPAITVGPAPLAVLRQVLATARREFTACQYVSLAGRLPALIAAAEATAAERPDPAVHQVLAEVHQLATRALIKLEASGLEWVSADRGMRAAHAAEDPLTLAESQRLVASVARRAGHHDRAQALTLAAADHLQINGNQPEPEHLAMHGLLHCSAGYAAARAGDRERATELLTEAGVTAGRLSDDPVRHRALLANVVSHRVSAAYVLGDAGAALVHARSHPLNAIPTTERRARLLVDTAMAYRQFGKPGQAYRTLLAAEHTAPGEVRTRNAVRRLVIELMGSPHQAAMPGLPALAARVHAAT